MLTRLVPDDVGQRARLVGRHLRRPWLLVTAVMAVTVTFAVVTMDESSGSVDPVPVDASLLGAFSAAATSCRALTPARLAGQVMAVSRFVPTPDGGIGGLTADQWSSWAPTRGAQPSDPRASIFALAHMTCDLVGQVRVAGVVGSPWHLAVAASQSTVAAVKAAGGVPPDIADLVQRADDYATWYGHQPGLALPGALATTGGLPANQPSPSTEPSVTTSPPTPSPSASRTSSPPTTNPPRPPASPTQRPPVPALNYPTFTTSSGLHLNGTATVLDGRLDLAAGSGQAGSAFATTLFDSAASFSTAFAVLITNMTDGVTFVVQTKGTTALGPSGGGLGYGSVPGRPDATITPSLAVELDLWDNSPDGFDPPGHQHIAVLTNGDIQRHITWQDPGFSMFGGGPTYVWLDYQAPSHTVTVYASQSSSRPASPLLSTQIDLKSLLGGKPAYVGFTGGTGHTNVTDARESILNWSITAR